MSVQVSTAVLIHGLHLDANGWESLVWGSPIDGVWGNIPRGVELAWRTQAGVIYWGTGASERDGKKECDVMFGRAIAGANELARLCNTTPELLTTFLNQRSIRDADAKDTNTEIRACLDKCIEIGVTDVTLVPLASQAPLAVRRGLWLVLEDEKFSQYRHRLSIMPSDTRYVGVGMQDIVIFTPPHRGDRVSNPSHALARRTLDVIQRFSKAGDKSGVGSFLSEWDLFLKKFEN